MRIGLALVQLACCIAFCLAFYPYEPARLEENVQVDKAHHHDDGKGAAGSRGLTFAIEQRPVEMPDAPGGAQRDAERLARKYGGPRSLEAVTNDPVMKRMTDFSVQEAAVSEEPFTVGVDQDGTNYAYFIKVELGSKRQQMYMLIDTGAGSSWVMGSGCTDEACAKHHTFDYKASESFHAMDDDFSVSYGSGDVKGKLASDDLTVAGVRFRYSFGLASTASSDFLKFPFDGILGLAMTNGSNDNFLDKMTAAHKFDKNIFCITLNRASDGANKGEIKFGSTNPDKFTGDISYSPLVSDEGQWAIQIDDIAFDGTKAEVGGIKTYIDTGTSFIFGPADKVGKIHSLVPGAHSATGQVFTVPCDTDKALTFTFSGVDYKVPPKDWVSSKNAFGKCTSNIYGHDVAKGSWLIGDTFLMNVYSVFDKDEKRIGFAHLASPDSKSASISGSGHIKTSAATATATTAAASGTTYGAGTQPSVDASSVVGGHEAPSAAGTEKPKATSGSTAAGGHSRVRSRVMVATLMAALAVFA